MLCEQKIISLHTGVDTFLDAAYGTAATGISPLDDSEGCGRRHDRGGGCCGESQETRLKEAKTISHLQVCIFHQNVPFWPKMPKK